MKRWTQNEFDHAKRDINGYLELGSGDFTAVDFGGSSRVLIGEGSVLGDGVSLGEMCEMGSNCEVGRECTLKGFDTIGRRCLFRTGARIGMGCKIGSNTRMMGACEIADGVEIGDQVQFPDDCMMGGRRMLGDTFIKISPVEHFTIYAFIGYADNKPDTKQQIFVRMSGHTWKLEEFADMAQCYCLSDQTVIANQRIQGAEMQAAANYLRERMAIYM